MAPRSGHCFLGAAAVAALPAACNLFLLPGNSNIPRELDLRASSARGQPAQEVRAGLSSATTRGIVLTAAAAAAVSASRSRATTLRAEASTSEDVPVALGEDGLPLDIEYDEELPPIPPFDPKEQVGITAPLGYFDPLGFAKVGEEEEFRKLRAAEIKHGRIAMMASIGLVGQHWLRFPGYENIKNTFRSQGELLWQPPAVWGLSLLPPIIMIMELTVFAQRDEREPGNFGDPLGLGMYDKDMRNREINNGRFAMFATLGIIAAQALTGKDAVQQLTGFSG